MTDEEFKNAMNKIIIFVTIVLVLMIILGIIIFNTFGKSTTIFKNPEQKENYENAIENNDENITENDIAEIEGNINENIENSVVYENNNVNEN